MSTHDDPVLRSSRREAVITFCVWFGALAYSVGYCTRFGYGRSLESIRFYWGIPDWVVWGLIAPWLVCAVVTIVFASQVMADDSLGEDTDFVAGDQADSAEAERASSSMSSRHRPEVR